MKDVIKVLVGMPVYDRPVYETQACWLELANNKRSIPGIELIPAMYRHFSGGTARNLLITEAKRLGCDKTLFIDHDVSFGLDTVGRILSHGVMIVGALAPKRTIESLSLCASTLPEPETENGLKPALYVGASLLCVDMRAIEVMERAFPETEYICHWEGFSGRKAHHLFAEQVVVDDWSFPDKPPFRRLMMEDVYFCYLARKAGITVYADMRCLVGHIGTVDFSEVHRRLIAANGKLPDGKH